MFTNKISVTQILINVYNESNEYLLGIINTTRDSMVADAKKAFIPYEPVNDDFLYGEIQGIEVVLDKLTELLEDTMLSIEEKTAIEILEENVIKARQVLRERNKGRSLGV